MTDNSKLRISIVSQNIKVDFICGEEADSLKMRAFLIYHKSSYKITCFIKMGVVNLIGGCKVGDKLSVDGFLTMSTERVLFETNGQEYARDHFHSLILNITDVKSKSATSEVREVPFNYARVLTH